MTAVEFNCPVHGRRLKISVDDMPTPRETTCFLMIVKTQEYCLLECEFVRVIARKVRARRLKCRENL